MLTALLKQSRSQEYEDDDENCYACGRSISSGGITYQNRSYHPDCVKCMHCHKILTPQKLVYEHNTELCCDGCYNLLHAEKCTICKNPINGGLTFKGQSYHHQCFKCTNCHKSLDGCNLYSKDLKPYCAQCNESLFADRCAKCGKPIPFNTNYHSIQGKPYHRHCFACVKCHQPITTTTFIQGKYGPTCHDCG